MLFPERKTKSRRKFRVFHFLQIKKRLKVKQKNRKQTTREKERRHEIQRTMDIGEIRIGNTKLRPDIAKEEIKVKLGKCLSTTKYILITSCVVLFVSINA